MTDKPEAIQPEEDRDLDQAMNVIADQIGTEAPAEPAAEETIIEPEQPEVEAEEPMDETAEEEAVEGEQVADGDDAVPDRGDDSIVKVTFIDDGDDREMDFALAGFRGTKMYPKRVEDPENPPIQSITRIKTGQSNQWSPEFTILDLMAMEPSALFYNYSAREFYENEKQRQKNFRRSRRLAAIQALRPDPNKGMIRRAVGALRRILTRRHYGPGPHPGTGTEQTVHGGGSPAASVATGARTGLSEADKKKGEVLSARPKHVGASVKLMELANPRTVIKQNSMDIRAWLVARDESDKWGTDQDTGERIERDSFSIANGVIDDAIQYANQEIRAAIEEAQASGVEDIDYEAAGVAWVDPDSGEAYGEIDQDIVDSYVNDMLNSDVDNDVYEAERYINELVQNTERIMELDNVSWDGMAEAIGKTPDEMLSMSNEEVDDAIQTLIFQRAVEIAKKNESNKDQLTPEEQSVVRNIDDYYLDQIASRFPSEADQYQAYGDASESILEEVRAGIEEYHEQNPMGYDYDYFINEMDYSPSTFRNRIDPDDLSGRQTFYGFDTLSDLENTNLDLGSLNLPDTFQPDGSENIFSAVDPNTGEILAVMETRDTRLRVTDEMRQTAAQQFGVNPDDVSDDFIYIGLLASKYPHKGYGTEAIMAALRMAHEQDKGITGAATMAASMFYAKLGAQYVTSMGVDEGGTAFWTNAQVHAAYNWMTEQLDALKSGELTPEQIAAEQQQAEAGFDPHKTGQIQPSAPREPAPAQEGLRPITSNEIEGMMGEQIAGERGRRGPRGASSARGNGVQFSNGWSASMLGNIERELSPSQQWMVFEQENAGPDQMPVVAMAVTPSPADRELSVHDTAWEIVGSDGMLFADEESLLRDLGDEGFTAVATGGNYGPTLATALTTIEPNSPLHTEIDDAGLWVNNAWSPPEESVSALDAGTPVRVSVAGVEAIFPSDYQWLPVYDIFQHVGTGEMLVTMQAYDQNNNGTGWVAINRNGEPTPLSGSLEDVRRTLASEGYEGYSGVGYPYGDNTEFINALSSVLGQSPDTTRVLWQNYRNGNVTPQGESGRSDRPSLRHVLEGLSYGSGIGRTAVRPPGRNIDFNVVQTSGGDPYLIMTAMEPGGDRYQIIGSDREGVMFTDDLYDTYPEALLDLQETFGSVRPGLRDVPTDTPISALDSSPDARQFISALAHTTNARGNVRHARDVIVDWLRENGREDEADRLIDYSGGMTLEPLANPSGIDAVEAEIDAEMETRGVLRRVVLRAAEKPDPKVSALRRLAELIEVEPAVLAIPDEERGDPLSMRHYGPGPHPGTGTPQEVHGGGRGPSPSLNLDQQRENLLRKKPTVFGSQITLAKLANIKANPLDVRVNDFSDRAVFGTLMQEARGWSDTTAGGFARSLASRALNYMDSKDIQAREESAVGWSERAQQTWDSIMAGVASESPIASDMSMGTLRRWLDLSPDQIRFLEEEGTLQAWIEYRQTYFELEKLYPDFGRQFRAAFMDRIPAQYDKIRTAAMIRSYAHSIFNDVYAEYVDPLPNVNSNMNGMIDRNEYKLAVGMLGDEVVSVATWTIDSYPNGQKRLYLETLGSKYPGHGHGTQMILRILKDAYDLNIGIGGHSLESALPFYQRLVKSITGKLVNLSADEVLNTYTWLNEAMNYLQDSDLIPEPSAVQPQLQIGESVGPAPKPTPEQMAPVIVPTEQVERHYGPGDHPGTGTPQTVHGKGGGSGGKTSVGITSARPGKESKQVFEDMRGFSDKLSKLKTVKNAKVEPGLGGWEGGSEPTWVVSYEGNGQALRLIAETAKQYDQDAVLLMKEGGGSVMTDFTFTDPVTPDERGAVEEILTELGIGGWTWYRTPGGGSTLRAVAVPQWGGNPTQHRATAKKLQQMLQAINMPHEYSESNVDVDVMEKEGKNAYDTVLAA